MKRYKIGGNLGNLLFQFAYTYTTILGSDDKEYSISKIPPILDINKLEYKPSSLVDIGEFLGFGESEKYFDNQLFRDLYSPSNEIKEKIIQKYGDFSNSLFISVRRGDFYGLRHWFICLKANYYEDMYDMITKNHTYDKVFLTSDDINWCKQNIHINDNNLIYLENETPENILFLGSLCKDFIISNSTFSWWCAWLGENNGGRIICPNNHFKTNYSKESNEMNEVYFPDRWEKQEVEKLGYCE